MPRRTVISILMGIALSAIVVGGQTAKPVWSVPRTPDGRPDFQGVWANNGMTPLERPKQFGLRATMTDAELADLKKRAATLMDGGDAFFADELVSAAIDGKTKFSSSDTQVGNYDQIVVVRPRVGQPYFAHHRSAGRPHSGSSDWRGRARTRTGGGPASERASGSRAGLVAGHPLCQLRHAEHPRRLSELLRDHARPGRRRAAQRDDSRRAHLLD